MTARGSRTAAKWPKGDAGTREKKTIKTETSGQKRDDERSSGVISVWEGRLGRTASGSVSKDTNNSDSILLFNDTVYCCLSGDSNT